ncbi:MULTISPECIES: hypothetical protein [unclassified Microcoleus]|uniref:hypothetical protein n=1 Tax=unclassified Microcoleus TaxID=2642155 RepID=UPI002FD488F0
MINYVETRISLSTFKVPGCCWRMRSRVRDRPKPTASAVGLVVKKRWQIFALIYRETLMVLSRQRSSTALASFCVFTNSSRVNFMSIDRFLATIFRLVTYSLTNTIDDMYQSAVEIRESYFRQTDRTVILNINYYIEVAICCYKQRNATNLGSRIK